MTARSAYYFGMVESKISFMEENLKNGDYANVSDELYRVKMLLRRIWRCEEAARDHDYQQIELAEVDDGEDRTV